MTHSIPDSCAVAVGTELGTVLVTGDYKFDQTPGRRPAGRRLAAGRAGPRGRAAALRRFDQRRPARLLAVRARGRPAPGGGVRPRRGPDRRHQLRLQHPPRPAGDRRRRGARAQGRAGRALDAQERQHRALARPHRGARRDADPAPGGRGLARPQGRRDLDRLAGRAAVGAAADGPQRPPADQAAPRRHRRLLGHPDPRQRARGQRDRRPAVPHRLRRDHPARRADPRLRARLRRGAQADAQPRHARATCMPDPRRPQADPSARPARRRGRHRSRGACSSGENGLPLEIDAAGARFGERRAVRDDLRRRRRHRRPGRRRAARPPDALGRRDLHRRRHRLRADRRVGRAARGDLPRRAVHRAGRRARRRHPRGGGALARPSRRRRASARSTCSSRSCTTISRRSSTTGCAAGRWCCRSSSRSEPRRCPRARPSGSRGTARGIRITKRVPTPFSGVSSATVPPCDWATARTIARPRPEPWPPSPPPRTKRSNTRARSSAGMPGPSSSHDQHRLAVAGLRWRPRRACPAACGARRSRAG